MNELRASDDPAPERPSGPEQSRRPHQARSASLSPRDSGRPAITTPTRSTLLDIGLLALVAVMVAGPPIYLMIHYATDGRFPSDYPGHIQLIQNALQNGSWQPHFLFQWTVYLLSGFQSGSEPLGWAMFAVALVCLTAKACLTYRIYARELTASEHVRSAAAAIGLLPGELILLLALGTVSLMPILDPRQPSTIYLGQMAPNIWHNPTSLFVWPLVILLFFAGYDYLEHPRPAVLGTVSLLFVLNVLAKPNFVMAFGPAFFIACLVRMGPSRRFVTSQLAVVPTLVILTGQAYWTYSHTVPTEATSVVFAPLQAWRMHSTSVPFSIARSIAFPLAYVVLYRDQLRRPGLLAFAWLTLAAALVWACLFAESGWRMWHFNFIWGAHLAIYPLFVVTLIDFLSTEVPSARSSVPAYVIMWGLLGLHLASGLLYFFRQAIGLGYT